MLVATKLVATVDDYDVQLVCRYSLFGSESLLQCYSLRRLLSSIFVSVSLILTIGFLIQRHLCLYFLTNVGNLAKSAVDFHHYKSDFKHIHLFSYMYGRNWRGN